VTKKKPQKPVYFEVRRMIDPATGLEVGALVPASGIDLMLLRERGYKLGDRIRALLQKPRNGKFHRLAHGLGTLVKEQIEKFSGKNAHDAVKELQLECGIECEVEEFDIPNLGRITRKVAKSISFDDMEEGAFKALFTGICSHICQTYWPGMTPEQVERQAEIMGGR
jgi:hypothetical protein